MKDFFKPTFKKIIWVIGSQVLWPFIMSLVGFYPTHEFLLGYPLWFFEKGVKPCPPFAPLCNRGGDFALFSFIFDLIFVFILISFIFLAVRNIKLKNQRGVAIGLVMAIVVAALFIWSLGIFFTNSIVEGAENFLRIFGIEREEIINVKPQYHITGRLYVAGNEPFTWMALDAGGTFCLVAEKDLRENLLKHQGKIIKVTGERVENDSVDLQLPDLKNCSPLIERNDVVYVLSFKLVEN